MEELRAPVQRLTFYPSSSAEIPRDTTHAHGWSFYARVRHLVAWLVSNDFFPLQSLPSGRDVRGKSVLFKGELHLSMMTKENSMDGLLKEAQHSKPASAKPSKTLTSSERESSPRSSWEVQPGTTKKATVTGAARPLSATRTEQTKTTGRVGPCRTKSPGRLANESYF